MINNRVKEFIDPLIQYGLLFFAFTSPLSISLSQATLGFLVLVSAFKWISGDQRFIRRTPLDVPFLFFTLVTLVASIASVNPRLSILEGLKSLWLISIAYLIAFHVTEERFIKQLLISLLAGTTLEILYGLTQAFSGLESILNSASGRVSVPRGFFSHKMTFAGFLMITTQIVFGLFLLSRSHKEKITRASMAILLITGVLLSRTRGAWLGLLSAWLLMGWLRGKTRVVLSLLFAFLVLTFALESVFQLGIVDRFKSIFSIEKNLDRVYIWGSTLDMIRDYPLLGTGPGTYKVVIPPYREKFDYHYLNLSHAHNNFIQQTAEKGLLGFFALLWLVLLTLRVGLSTYFGIDEQQHFEKGLALGCLGAIVSFHIEGIFEANFGDEEIAMLLWL
ncbi:MAG: O-antigen ligase family protein, partial [Candidatus Tectomicrobia bacterium]|nr:O-antigen ligase family protein [Candidatus Tectomicrobia bacterium]